MKLKSKHFKQLLSTATECIINKKPLFIISVPSSLEWPAEWPSGRLIEQTESTNKYSFVASDVLDSLYKLGKSSYDTKMLKSEMRSVDMTVKMLIHHCEEVNSNEHKRKK